MVCWWRTIEPQNCNIFDLFCSRILHVWIFMWFWRIFIDLHVKLSFNFHFAWPRWRSNLRQCTSSVPRFPELTFHSEARLGASIQDGWRTYWRVKSSRFEFAQVRKVTFFFNGKRHRIVKTLHSSCLKEYFVAPNLKAFFAKKETTLRLIYY